MQKNNNSLLQPAAQAPNSLPNDYYTLPSDYFYSSAIQYDPVSVAAEMLSSLLGEGENLTDSLKLAAVVDRMEGRQPLREFIDTITNIVADKVYRKMSAQTSTNMQWVGINDQSYLGSSTANGFSEEWRLK